MVCTLPIDMKTAREKLSGSNRHEVRREWGCKIKVRGYPQITLVGKRGVGVNQKLTFTNRGEGGYQGKANS